MVVLRCLLFLVAVSAAFASDVPVLMWSPERPLSDLPQAPAFERISQDTFHSRYLAHLLSKDTNVIVAFLQDKLNINDISKYADVYNLHSEGGAFKNVKGLLDEHFSLELPRVLGSHRALQSMQDSFPGDIHHVTSASDLAGLDLGKGNHLVMVRLLPVVGAHDAEAAIASNDELMGEVSRQLQKLNVKFTALYTAETSQERQKREVHQTRQLMEASQDVMADGMFFNVSYGNGSMLYAYLTSLTLCAVPSFTGSNIPTHCQVTFTVNATDLKDAKVEAELTNSTVYMQLAMSGIKTANSSADEYSVTIIIPFEHQLDRWEIQDAILTVSNSSGELVTNATMVTRGYDPVVPLLYSFHCTSMDWFPKNTSKPMLGYITLGGFQVQPFNVIGDEFLLSQDCVGWFSTAIWMSLFPVSINIVILLFGMYMIMSLTTNDRFDDPKGKALIINSGE